MKKVIITLSLAIVIALGVAVYYVLTNLDDIVRAAIEKYGSQATGTAVRVDKVHLELGSGARQGSGAIHGLTIANPAGFGLPHAFYLGEIKTQIDLRSLQKEPYVIDNILIRAPGVFFEVNQDKKINLQQLQNNLKANLKTGGEAKTQKDSGAKQKEPRLVIKKFVFAAAKVQAKLTPLNKDYTLNLPDISFTDLGGPNGLTPTEMTSVILQRLIDHARAEIKRKGIDAELDKLKAGVKEKVETEKAKLKDKADSKLEAEKQKAADKLKGLLRKE